MSLPREGEGGFTLIELIIGMLLVAILIGSIAGSMIVSFRTTGVTNHRLAESNGVLIVSSYLANDVQSAASVQVSSSTADCSGASTTLVTFTYSSAGTQAVYACGSANGQSQITRTFGSAPTPTHILAHYSGTARPDVHVTYDSASVPVSASITFTKASDCTLDCTYTLFGSRRGYNPPGAGGTNPTNPDVTLLSTGVASPLWVQGSCPDPGTSNACVLDPSITALPISDVTGFTMNWTPTPAVPTTLFDKLNDQNAATFITNTAGKATEARVLLSSVDPPLTGVNPSVEFHVVATSGTGSAKATLSLYNGSNLLASNVTGAINGVGSYDWALTTSIPTAAYNNLTLGFALTTATNKNNESISVDGVAVDTAAPAGLLTIKGPLYVNSQLSNAVRLIGQKTANKISITNGGNFEIWDPGACSGCNHNTVTCAACAWTGNQPWTNYPSSIPDPLRALPAPDPSTLGTGSCNGAGVCQPGVYSSTLSRTSNTTLNPGIYYLQHGLSVTGNATLSCASPCTGGVMIYIAGPPVACGTDLTCASATFAGNGAMNLPAPSSGVYQNILIFQARGIRNAVKITGNAGSGVTNVFGGIVYVPNSIQVTLATGAAALTAKAIISQNLKVSSSVTIG